GLPNRRYFLDELERAVSTDSTTAVLVLDLDGFKEINDTLGHHHGDLLLQQVAKRLTEQTRPGDLVARLRGGESGILLPTARGGEDCVAVVRRVLAGLEGPMSVKGADLDVR